MLIEADDAGDADHPHVAADPGGNAIAVWNQNDGTRYNIWSNRYTPSGGWGTAALIETEDAGDARSPKVAIDPGGNATTVWSKFDGVRDNIRSNRFE